jgi:hypothetical protein
VCSTAGRRFWELTPTYTRIRTYTHTHLSHPAPLPACPQEIDNQIAEMQRDEAPEWALDLMRWTRRLSSEVVDTNVQRYTALVDRRQAFVSGLRELERELEQQPPAIAPDETAADWVALAGYNWAQQVCGWLAVCGFGWGQTWEGGLWTVCLCAVPVALAGRLISALCTRINSGCDACGPCRAVQEGEDATPEKLKTMLREALEQTSSPGGRRQRSAALPVRVVPGVCMWPPLIAGAAKDLVFAGLPSLGALVLSELPLTADPPPSPLVCAPSCLQATSCGLLCCPASSSPGWPPGWAAWEGWTPTAC